MVFNGITVEERYQSDMLPVVNGGGRLVMYPIPYSDNTHIELLGKDLGRVTLLAKSSLGDYDLIFHSRNESHTLDFSLGSFTAILESVSSAAFIDPALLYVEYSLNFIVSW